MMMKPARECALCPIRVRDRDRLCPEHITEYKDRLTYDVERRSYRPGVLTPSWLSAIIEYAEYEHNVNLRDYGRTISLDKVRTI